MQFFKLQFSICESRQHGAPAFGAKIDSEEISTHPCCSITLESKTFRERRPAGFPGGYTLG
jgi:hypothetical protein